MISIGGDEPLVEGMKRQRISGIAAGGLLQGGQILLPAARDTVQLFGFGVVRLEVFIGNRPVPDCARNPFAVGLPRPKILLTGPD